MKTDATIEYRDAVISLVVLSVIYYYFPHAGMIILLSAFVVFCALSRPFRKLNHQFWSGLTRITQSIFSPIIMTALFFVVIIPIGLLFQLKNRKQSNTPISYLSEYSEEYNEAYFKRQW